MNIKNQCIPCMTKSLVKLAEKVTDQSNVQQDIIEFGLKQISNNPYEYTGPYITAKIYEYAKLASGNSDPYDEEKKVYNQIAEDLIIKLGLNKEIKNSKDPLETAVRLSIAGNIIDFSVGYDVDQAGVQTSIEHSLKADLFGMDMEAFKEEIEKAEKIMVISDNAGEIVFDKLLVNELPREKVVYVVKQGSIVNDAIMKDAIETGMTELVSVIDNGTAIQGTLYSECSDTFRKAFYESDLIISKGQANFETLEVIEDKSIYYLLRAKCQIIADQAGCEKGAFVFMKK